MRKSPQEQLHELKQLLNRLNADWSRINRPQVNKNVRDSLYTRIVEIKASISAQEEAIRKANRRKKVVAAAAE